MSLGAPLVTCSLGPPPPGKHSLPPCQQDGLGEEQPGRLEEQLFSCCRAAGCAHLPCLCVFCPCRTARNG